MQDDGLREIRVVGVVQDLAAVVEDRAHHAEVGFIVDALAHVDGKNTSAALRTLLDVDTRPTSQRSADRLSAVTLIGG